MLIIEEISKSFGGEYIFEKVSLTIKDGDKIGIVGPNGIGKSTFIKCIIDDHFLDSGNVDRQKHSIGYLEQNSSLNENHTVYEELYHLFPNLENINKQLQEFKEKEAKESLSEEELATYIDLEAKFMELGGYQLETNFVRFMTGFSFNKDDLNKKIKDFSGGEKTKLVLIKLLLLDPDFLVLDEPTNHLDIYAIAWLEKYLKNLKKGLILISHDQEFLNNTCNKILEFRPNSPKMYNTKFENYLKQRKLDYDVELAQYENQLKLIKKYNDFIDKFRGKPSKVGQVNDRKNKLERMEIIDKPIDFNQKIDFEFTGYNLKKNAYIEFVDADFGYNGVPLIKDFNLQVFGGDKIFLVGSNGVGKTTIFKTILGEIPLIKGKIKRHSNIKIGYFDQEQKNVPENKTLYDLIYETNKFDSQTAIRKYLARFLFQRDDVFKKVQSLSGGEKVRLTLALMALDSYDLILMDEPTNHLDYDSKEVLEQVLEDFPGSLLVITHDRYLIDRLATSIIEIKDEKAIDFAGNWNQYQSYLEGRKENALNNKNSKIGKAQDKKDKNVDETLDGEEKKEEIKPTPKKKVNMQKLELIELDIEKFEEEKKELEKLLQDRKIIKDHVKRNEILEELTENTSTLESLYKNYEETLGE